MEPVRKEGYDFDPADQHVQDVMDSQFNEVALDYNAGFTASLAWLCAHALSSGEALPDTEFPPKNKRHESLDLLTADREFFVSANVLSNSAEGTEIEATIWNRSRWPAPDRCALLPLLFYSRRRGDRHARRCRKGQSRRRTARAGRSAICGNFWLKDEVLEESANLPDPGVIAAGIAADLEAALERIVSIAEDLK